jgi:signal transduction histidine kinase
VEALIGVQEHLKTILKILGSHPVGTVIPINEEAATGLSGGKLTEVFGGLQTLTMGGIPAPVCRGIERVLGVGDAYAMGFVSGEVLYGSAVVLVRRGITLKGKSIIETFLRQAGIALQRRHAEDALRKARDELEMEVDRRTRQLVQTRDMLVQSEKLAAIGRLSAAVAHEILNPVNIISMRLQLLEKAGNLPVRIQDTLNVCREQVKRVIDIIDELGQFSRDQSRGKILCDINDVVGQVLSLCAPQLRQRDIQLNVQYDANIPEIPLEKGRVEQVFFNLVTNATEAMEGRESRVLQVSTDYPADGECIRVQITDTGPGIAKEDFKHIFDPFYTTKDQGSGIGLGLFISYNIIKEHGGRIWAENNEEGGVSFYTEFHAGRGGSQGVDS